MSERKYHDIILPEVRKPAGYGTLVAVVVLTQSKRELWFQHPENPDILRCIEVDVTDCNTAPRPRTIKTRAERAK